MPVMRRLLAVSAVIAASCASPPDPGLARARATIQELAGAIGSRPIGSSADARARDYVAAALRDAGFEVRIQETDAVAPSLGLTAHVLNVIATRAGTDPAAIALVSHYDSVPNGPGAQDDALGVATCLEAARRLATGPLHHALMVLVTDGEEVGLMGARGVVTDPEVSTRVRAFLNFDGTGGTGPPVLFEAGPGRGDTLAAWARGATAPFGGSFGVEIYKRLPNDTDFTILKGMGASGLNFAPIGDSYVYHTDRDRPAGVSDDTISREIANTIGIVHALDDTSLARVDDEPTFFDLGQRTGVVYGATAARRLGILACLVGVVAWGLVTRRIAVDRGADCLTSLATRAVVVSGVAVTAMIGATALLRSVRHETTPWYASPQWTFGGLAALGCLMIWMAAWVRGDRREPLSPPGVWWCALPAWIGLTLFLLVAAPAASYLAALPLLVFGGFALVSRRDGWLRLTSACLLAVALVLWATNIVVLLGFLVPLFGWLPILTPVWIYPCVIALAGLMLVPPCLGLCAGTRLVRQVSRLIGAGWATVVIVFGAVALVAEPYTADRPARRSARYVQDDVRRQAWWDVAGSDATLSPPKDTPPGAEWTRAHGPIAASFAVPGLDSPIAFRAATPPLVAKPPADVRAALAADAGGRLTLRLILAPRALVSARLVLPRGVRPVRASLPGVVQRDQWMATYVAVPSAGLEIRIEFSQDVSRETLAGIVALIMVPGLPSSGSGQREPLSWLPELPGGPATWQTRSLFILPVVLEGT
jgi:hypothetical protein